MTVLSIAGQISIVLGALILLSSGIGVLKFPDAYTRTSAVSTAAGFGVVFVVAGALLIDPSVSNAVKVAVIVPLQLVTSAVASTAIARSAYITGVAPTRLRYDQLSSATPDDDGHTR
ncbi:cation:proton antiporter [Rhodococcoides fascians]|uniref:cation:proton antiporter n=1 Tax=Rhodococcoides fascians TaxID=1828 RepID=UPI00056AC99B|nr:monovalent cation/H(+) antiporter subunit G [Rhodococcus fascians]